jgi:hypothetical protein
MGARKAASAGIDAEHVIPLTTVTFSGHRYVAAADLGLARPVPLMIHGNARMYLSLTHAVAEALTGSPVPRLEDYGYSRRGKGAIDVPSLRFGSAAFDGIAEVPVFDFTDAPDHAVQGMLGTRFLTAARAAVDFRTDSLLLGVRSSDPHSALRGPEDHHVPLHLAADGRVTIAVRFPAIDRVLPITPSTVANALTLHMPLFAGQVAMAPSTRDQSPSGTRPEVFTSEDIEFEIAGITCRADATFEDLAEYGNVDAAELESYGMLGYDWMREHGAVIDYANRILSFNP